MSYGYKTELIVDNCTFEVSVFSYEFDKNINDTGEVISNLDGGIIHLSISNLPKVSLLEWALKHRSFKNGTIQITDIETNSYVIEEEIMFNNAACINMKIIYERNNTNYFTTLMSISPQDICLGRNDCWVNKDWKSTPIQTSAPVAINKDKLKDIFDFEDISIDCILNINGQKYEIEAFETEFRQPEDFKGEPQHEVKGGLLLVTLKQKTDNNLNRWMFQRNISYSGTIIFAPKIRISSIPFIITFTQGKCISFNKVGGSNVGLQLTLLISAEEININGVKHTNSYK